MEFESNLKPLVSRIDSRLDELLAPETESPELLHAAMRYSCLAPGKRLRPALVMMVAEACGGEPLRGLDFGCAIEMIHAFSLIHDDLPALDNDDLRRGRPTCHVKFGEAVAILAGDALFALAFETVAKADFEPATVVEVLKILAESVGTYGLVGGETIDILSEGSPVDEITLERIHDRKTAALIRVACEIGALVAGGDRQALRLYGQDVGLAFQIADDILNETGTAESLGKAAGSDRERGKATYPALFGLDESRRKAEALVEEAVRTISTLPKPDALIQLAQFSIRRLR